MGKKRSEAHIRAQKAGKRRDDYTCQVCGSTERVEGHHVFEFCIGGAPHKDNIITLCHDCHVAVHRGQMDIYIG